MADMGIGPLGSPDACFLRKFRWMIEIQGVAGNSSTAILPPSKAARPKISFREIEIQHLTETVYYPGKPDWKPLNVTLYGLNISGDNPVYTWFTDLYDPRDNSAYTYPVDGKFILSQITLQMYSPCGDIVEEWTYEDCWLQDADFEDLDMSESGLVNVNLTIRYARAYIVSH